MPTPQNGNGQQETILVSQGKTKAEVVLITTYPNGQKVSQTKHYRVVGGQFTSGAAVVGGREKQRENGQPKPRRG
jgi:hypothetical protein